MSKIVVELSTGFACIDGDRISFDSEREMFFCYQGGQLVGAFDRESVLKIYVSRKGGVV